MDNWYYKHCPYDPYILVNIFADKRTIDPFEEEPEEIPEPPESLDYSFLPDKQQQVFALYLQGKNFTASAKVLGISKQAVAKLFKRACINVRLQYPQRIDRLPRRLLP